MSKPHPHSGLLAGTHTRDHVRAALHATLEHPHTPNDDPIPVITGNGSESGSDWEVVCESDVASDAQPALPAGYTAGASVTFTVNGKECTVKPSPHLRLAEYLRYEMQVTGVKIGCGEGGCGACTVLLTTKNSDGSPHHALANSCLRPVWSLNGVAVTTTEGLGSTRSGQVHPIQAAVAKHDGTQCGYCTPGFVMNMAGLLAKAKATGVTVDEKTIESQFAGNLCRCTGYRPIFDAMRSVAKEVASGRGHGPCKNECGGKKDGSCGRRPGPCGGSAFDIEDLANAVPSLTESDEAASCAVGDDGSVWVDASNLDETIKLLGQYAGKNRVRLVVGNTSIGVAKYYAETPEADPEVYINIARVPELLKIETSNSSITFGAAVTLANVISSIEGLPASSGLSVVSAHLSKVAHHQVRDVGSWAGNVMMAKTHRCFPSDVVLLLCATNATLTIQGPQGEAQVAMSKFVSADYKLPADSILKSVSIPFVEEKTSKLAAFDTYKIMSRHINTHAEVNAAFYLYLNDDNSIREARVLYGNIRVPGPFTCPKTTAALKGKPLNQATLEAVLPILKSETVPAESPIKDPNFAPVDPEYRHSLAQNLFYKFFLTCLSKAGATVDSRLSSALGHYERPISKGSQSYPAAPDSEAPVGKPIAKLEGERQACGEVRYTADLDLPTNTLFATPLLARRLGNIKAIDVSQSLALPGVERFVSAKDTDHWWCTDSIGGRRVFARKEVGYVGELLGLMLGSSFEAARRGVQAAVVKYEEGTPEYIDFKKAEQRGDVIELPECDSSKIFPSRPARGTRTAWDRATEKTGGPASIEGTMTTTGQKHFYLENQVAFVRPDSDGELHIAVASQAIQVLRGLLAVYLRKWISHLHVTNTQIGGAYGGKAFLPQTVTAATCVAAIMTERPVLFQLERTDDMNMLAGRPAAETKFSVTVDPAKNHEITALTMTATADAGHMTNKVENALLNMTQLNAYEVKNAKLKTHYVTTNHPLTTIMRAPGELEGALFTESAVEAAAKAAGVDPRVVQAANMSSECKAVWDAAMKFAKDNKVYEDAAEFNKKNKYRKRGVYSIPVQYGMNSRLYGESATVVVNQDGSVFISHSGLEMGQGINTKAAQAVLMKLSDVGPVKMEHIAMNLTKSTDQYGGSTPTWGSGTSESVVHALLKACDGIVKKMKGHAVKDDWNATAAAAVKANRNRPIEESGEHYPAVSGGSYKITCAAVVIAEIDTLTGETELRQAEMFYDCGVSLNPAVDIGQVEGCFVQATGMMLTEHQVRSPVDGRLINSNTWDYKIPSSLDIPHVMNVTFIPSVNKASGNVLGSKASGEPGYLLGVASLFAVKNAVYAAREEAGETGYFELHAPATPEHIQLACKTKLA